MINEYLPDQLTTDSTQAVGLWDEDLLIAVSAWKQASVVPRVWTSLVLAVRSGYMGRGHAVRLKRDLLKRAREAGVDLLTSTVHRDNDRMLRLNEHLGADVRPDPEDWRKEYLICMFPLQ